MKTAEISPTEITRYTVLQQAYKLGLYGPKIVWMFVAWYSSDFWLRDLDDVPCTAEEMSLAADGAFVIGFYYRNPVAERGISGITGKCLLEPPRGTCNKMPYATSDAQFSLRIRAVCSEP